MPTYQYKSIDSNGKYYKGNLKVSSESEVESLLFEQG